MRNTPPASRRLHSILLVSACLLTFGFGSALGYSWTDEVIVHHNQSIVLIDGVPDDAYFGDPYAPSELFEQSENGLSLKLGAAADTIHYYWYLEVTGDTTRSSPEWMYFQPDWVEMRWNPGESERVLRIQPGFEGPYAYLDGALVYVGPEDWMDGVLVAQQWLDNGYTFEVAIPRTLIDYRFFLEVDIVDGAGETAHLPGVGISEGYGCLGSPYSTIEPVEYRAFPDVGFARTIRYEHRLDPRLRPPLEELVSASNGLSVLEAVNDDDGLSVSLFVERNPSAYERTLYFTYGDDRIPVRQEGRLGVFPFPGTNEGQLGWYWSYYGWVFLRSDGWTWSQHMGWMVAFSAGFGLNGESDASFVYQSTSRRWFYLTVSHFPYAYDLRGKTWCFIETESDAWFGRYDFSAVGWYAFDEWVGL